MGLPGKDGEPGRPGRDGALENLKVQYDGERTFTFCFKDGAPVQGGKVQIPFVLDRGVYKEGTMYEKGDGLTWGGSFWIAQDATSAKPGTSDVASRAWRLAVKAGREGKQGPTGPQGEPGKKGDKGDRGPDRW
jgi:hypothetical protein